MVDLGGIGKSDPAEIRVVTITLTYSQPAERNRLYDVFSNDYNRQLAATTEYHVLLSGDKSRLQIERAIKGGVIPRLVELLQGDMPILQVRTIIIGPIILVHSFDLQRNICRLLNPVVQGVKSNLGIQNIICINAVPKFIDLLSSPSLEVQHEVVRIFRSIAQVGPASRDHVLRAGALQPLLTLLSRDHEASLLTTATRTLRHFCGGTHTDPDWNLVSSLFSFGWA